MKIVIYTILLLPFLLACTKKPMDDPAKTVINEQATEQAQGIVEENNSCICTKEYKPVCSKDGKTYPSVCQAACDGVKEFTEGPCPNK